MEHCYLMFRSTIFHRPATSAFRRRVGQCNTATSASSQSKGALPNESPDPKFATVGRSMTARISLNLRRTGGHRPPLQSEHFLPVTVVVCQREVRMRSNLVRHFIRVTAMLALPLSGYVQNAPSQSTT